MKKASFGKFFFFILLLSICACKKPAKEPSPPQEAIFYRAADLSAWPEIELAQLEFFNQDSIAANFLDILQSEGLNTVRLRLWHQPDGRHHSLAEVDSFSRVLKARGLKLWLCLHLSDTWADPGQQQIPAAWNNLPLSTLQDSLYHYVYRVSRLLKPDIIQIGNEINAGFLWPYGDRWQQPASFKTLLDTAILAARAAHSSGEIMLHYAGINQGALDFFEDLAEFDFDIIGLSYYPIWHGKSLLELENTLDALGAKYRQSLMIAETAYPFTLDWNDWTNNIVGLEDQLIPGFPASPAGQANFIKEIRRIVEANPKGLGFGYWGGELVAWKGAQASDASPFENQALFNFNNRALPVQSVFNP
ncbi:MAG: arabinogalactan endo-1,4-beta-galactosidase [Bacteroidetes bacterium]|nr:arabinogalactan endo-1,4-beta-galactosidase [Bacteroidota bacterium]